MRRTIAILVLVLAVPAFAQTQGHRTKTAAAKVSRADATKTALAKAPGKIKSSELETENGLLVYSFDIQTKAGIREIQVDANTGAVVSDKVESPADEAKEKAADEAAKKARKAGKAH